MRLNYVQKKVRVHNHLVSSYMYHDCTLLLPILIVNVTNEVVEFVDSEPSEISLGPDPVVSTVDLFCTVVNQGLYSWQWSFEGALFTPHTLSDATRTSTITVSSLSAGSAGLYKCQTAVNIIRNITISLSSRSNTADLLIATFMHFLFRFHFLTFLCIVN